MHQYISLFTAFLLGFSTFSMTAQEVVLVPAKSSVKFTISNFGLNVKGSFKGLKVVGTFDPNDLGNSQITATVDASTIDTDNKKRNKSLRGKDYFHVEQHPEITISSTAISRQGNGFLFKGTLSMKGTTKSISFPFAVDESNGEYLLKGKLVVNRRDYKVGKSSWVLGDDATLTITCALKR